METREGIERRNLKDKTEREMMRKVGTLSDHYTSSLISYTP
jgi:hypothetical protein